MKIKDFINLLNTQDSNTELTFNNDSFVVCDASVVTEYKYLTKNVKKFNIQLTPDKNKSCNIYTQTIIRRNE